MDRNQIEQWARAAFERHAAVSGEHGRWDDLEDCPEVREAWVEAAALVVLLHERHQDEQVRAAGLQ